MSPRSTLPASVAIAACLLVPPASAGAATIAVTTTADVVAADGRCSLREAVTAANANAATAGAGECTAGQAAVTDRIVLPAGTYRRTIAGGAEDANARGDLDVTSSMEIVGAGPAATIIDAAGLDRVIDVLASATSVRIADLALTGGVAPAGVSRGPFTGFSGEAGGNGEAGGGIRSHGAKVVLERLRVVANTGGSGGAGADTTGLAGTAGAVGQTGVGGQGGNGGTGGIAANGGDLTLSQSVVSDNRGGTGGAGGAGRGGSAEGGLVPAEGGRGTGGTGGAGGSGGLDAFGTVTIRDSAILGNRAGAGGPGGAGRGGDAGAGGAGANGGIGTGGTGGRGGDGGGIRVLWNVVIERTTVASNTTGSGGVGGSGRGGSPSGSGDFGPGTGGAGGTGGYGGGIAKFNPAALSLQNVTVSGNLAAGGGGGGGGGFGVSLGPGSAGGAGGAGGSGGGLVTSGTGSTTASFLTLTANGAGGPGGTGNSGMLGSAGAQGPTGTPGAGAGAGISSDAAVSLTASIVVGNSCGGTFFVADGGANLAQNAAGCPGAAGDARLGPLSANGGTPPTHALGAGSAAIDRAPAGAGCPAADARGAVRPVGAGCDAGAFEVAPPLATTGGAAPSGAGMVLQGGVQTRGLPVGVTFELGTTTAYGTTTPPVAVAGAAAPSSVSVTVAGLVAGRVYHYRVVVRGQDGTATGEDRTFTAGSPATAASDPRVTGFAATPRRFAPVRRGGAPAPARRGRPARGTVVSFTLSEPASVRLEVARTLPGRTRRAGTRTVCRAVARPVRAGRCVAVRAAGSVLRRGVAGRNRIVLTGRLGGRALVAGTYRLTMTATDADGLRSAPVRTTVTVVRG